ncbi:hypothetical protein ALP29_200912 [Pseudomonas syringae pv. avii]|uniref:Uncharacterized protein n=1 Tax=Pseudomonas syringae pv. avii TaxID=663959 RepID=A0A3M5VTQ5_PSESX|nr:hypothetical protein ALP29_200912 [Pseudomonas syringae pv. avii]
MRFDTQQRLRLELAQCFAHGHPADAKQRCQFLLAQGCATGKAAIDNGISQFFFNHGSGKVRRRLLIAQYGA